MNAFVVITAIHSRTEQHDIFTAYGARRKYKTINDKTMNNQIAKTILPLIGGIRFATMTRSSDFINLSVDLRINIRATRPRQTP